MPDDKQQTPEPTADGDGQQQQQEPDLKLEDVRKLYEDLAGGMEQIKDDLFRLRKRVKSPDEPPPKDPPPPPAGLTHADVKQAIKLDRLTADMPKERTKLIEAHAERFGVEAAIDFAEAMRPETGSAQPPNKLLSGGPGEPEPTFQRMKAAELVDLPKAERDEITARVKKGEVILE